MTTEATPLITGLVGAFVHSVRSLLAVCDEMGDDDRGRDTDLPGWSVGDVVVHICAIECELAGDPLPAPQDDHGPHVRGAFRRHIEDGVLARRTPCPRPAGEPRRARRPRGAGDP